jgi:hypothetical protein
MPPLRFRTVHGDHHVPGLSAEGVNGPFGHADHVVVVAAPDPRHVVFGREEMIPQSREVSESSSSTEKIPCPASPPIRTLNSMLTSRRPSRPRMARDDGFRRGAAGSVPEARASFAPRECRRQESPSRSISTMRSRYVFSSRDSRIYSSSTRGTSRCPRRFPRRRAPSAARISPGWPRPSLTVFFLVPHQGMEEFFSRGAFHGNPASGVCCAQR